MIDRADSDGDGLVTFEDFFNIMTKKTFAWWECTYYRYSEFIKIHFLLIIIFK